MKTTKVIATSSGIYRNLSTVTVTAMIMATGLAIFGVRSIVAEQVLLFKGARVPRVYNALITSDQRLLPSQANPIVTPVFRPFSLFDGYNVYNGYNGWPSVYMAPAPYFAVAPATDENVHQSVDVNAATSVNADADADVNVDDERRRSQPVVKNNRPINSSVPDIPPPPLPVSATVPKNKKKPEEYPPAPVGFAI